MAFMNSKASIDAAASMLSSTLEGEAIENNLPTDEPNVSPYKEKPIEENAHEVTATTTKSSGIHVYSNILLAPAKDGASRLQQSQASQSRTITVTLPTLTTTVNSISSTKQSPLKYSSGSIISKLPLPKISKPSRHNGNDDNMEIESPYSPGSSDYEDLFEPPQNSPSTSAHVKKHSSRSTNIAKQTTTAITSTSKPDKIFDDLFGSTSPLNKNLGKVPRKRRPSKHSASIKGSNKFYFLFY